MIRRILLAAVLAASMVSVSSYTSPAEADDCDTGGTTGCGDAEAKSGGTGYFPIGGTSCGAWVSTGGWGGTCASPGSYSGNFPEPPTWQEIIDMSPGRRFDPCRLDKLAPGFSPPPPPTDEKKRAKGDEWLIRTCMTGYDLDSTDGGDNIELVFERVWDRYEEEPEWMRLIWGDVENNQSSFPYAMVDYGPNPYPVVNSPIFFNIDFQYFTADGPQSLGARGHVEVPLGTDAETGQQIYLVAKAKRVDIKPGDGATVNCNSEADRRADFEVGEDNIEDFAETTKCQHTYANSSAAQDGETYDVTARARWIVRYRIGEDGPLRHLSNEGTTFVQTDMSYQIPVQEVQVRDCVVADLCAGN